MNDPDDGMPPRNPIFFLVIVQPHQFRRQRDQHHQQQGGGEARGGQVGPDRGDPREDHGDHGHRGGATPHHAGEAGAAHGQAADGVAVLVDVLELATLTAGGADGRGGLHGVGVSVVNALSVAPDFDLMRLPAEAVVMDMTYRPVVTPLLQAARTRGLVTVDGLAMLIGQAAPSFEALFRRPPPPLDLRTLLMTHLGETA